MPNILTGPIGPVVNQPLPQMPDIMVNPTSPYSIQNFTLDIKTDMGPPPNMGNQTPQPYGQYPPIYPQQMYPNNNDNNLETRLNDLKKM